jgi:hypothetical protein
MEKRAAFGDAFVSASEKPRGPGVYKDLPRSVPPTAYVGASAGPPQHPLFEALGRLE